MPQLHDENHQDRNRYFLAPCRPHLDPLQTMLQLLLQAHLAVVAVFCGQVCCVQLQDVMQLAVDVLLPTAQRPPGETPDHTPDYTLIISLGRLERYKGHQHMINALPKIREQRPDARLLILGAGSYASSLRKLAQKAGVAEHIEIRAIPAGDRQAMAETLFQASLVALMSEYEAHPVAVMEALSLQRPSRRPREFFIQVRQ